jgi:hypothetical protein
MFNFQNMSEYIGPDPGFSDKLDRIMNNEATLLMVLHHSLMSEATPILNHYMITNML